MVQDIELDEEKFTFDERDDVFSISNVLKQCMSLFPIHVPKLSVKQIFANCLSPSFLCPILSA